MLISSNNAKQEWRFVATVLRKDGAGSIAAISRELHQVDGLESFQLSFARN
jgi:putative Mg2+ transporter-C (MgtC) family protein